MQEVSLALAQDHVASIFEMKSNEKGLMPTLEDLHIINCDLVDALFILEEKYDFTVPSNLKTITIEKCDKLKTIVAGREERKDVINFFAQLVSLRLKELPNLMRFCFFGSYESLDEQQDTMGNKIICR